MTDTTFTDNTTVIMAAWLNDLNLIAYHLLGNAGTPPATRADILTNLGMGGGTYTDGEILIGNTGTGALDTATITAGTGISITNGAGSITITNTAPAVTGEGALAYKSGSAQSISISTHTAITFNAEEYDTNSIHDNVTNNDRLTVPTGVTKVKLSANLKITGLADNNQLTEVSIYKNALSNGYNGCARIEFTATQGSGGETLINLSSPVLIVIPGDYFTVDIFTNDTAGCSVENDFSTWFSMEIIE